MKKKTLSITATDFSPHDFEGTLVDVRGRINDLIDQYGPTAKLDYDAHFYYDYDPNPSPRFNVITYREETDEEYNLRLITEKTHRDMVEERERAEFERLAAKFKK